MDYLLGEGGDNGEGQLSGAVDSTPGDAGNGHDRPLLEENTRQKKRRKEDGQVAIERIRQLPSSEGAAALDPQLRLGAYGEFHRLQQQQQQQQQWQQQHPSQQNMTVAANTIIQSNQATLPSDASGLTRWTASDATSDQQQSFPLHGPQQQTAHENHRSLFRQAAIMPNQMIQQGLQMPPSMFQPPNNFLNAGFPQIPNFSAPVHNQSVQASLGSMFPGNPAALWQQKPRGGQLQSSILSGKKPVLLYMSCDDDSLSPYQCLVRKQIELYEADRQEVESNAKGRNKPIVLGQVGIRCRHCSMLHHKTRDRGSKYYPAKLNGLYQAAQSMASGHLCYHCKQVPQSLRNELLILREKKSSAGGGKKYWGDGVRVLGVYEDEHGLRFKKK
eukprot:scaffold360_cov107-Cylindrotheca_fusiformis.AAC.2